LTEVVRTGREHRGGLSTTTEPPAGADEVDGRVVALGQLGRELGGETLVAVQAVAREVVPQPNELVRIVGRQEWVDDDGRRHAANPTRPRRVGVVPRLHGTNDTFGA